MLVSGGRVERGRREGRKGGVREERGKRGGKERASRVIAREGEGWSDSEGGRE